MMSICVICIALVYVIMIVAFQYFSAKSFEAIEAMKAIRPIIMLDINGKPHSTRSCRIKEWRYYRFCSYRYSKVASRCIGYGIVAMGGAGLLMVVDAILNL